MSDVPSNLIPTRITQLPVAPVADENSLMMIVYQGNNYQIRVGDLLSVAGVPVTRAVLAGTGLQGGGQLSSNVTLSIAPGGVGSAELANSGVTPGVYGTSTDIPVFTVDATGRVTAATTIPATISGYVPDTRQVIAGTGLNGGGMLSTNVTLNANLSSATPQSGFQSGSAGVSTDISRADHKHPAVDLGVDDEVDGVLGLDNGGTAKSIVPDEGAIIWCGADGFYVGPVGAIGQALLSGGTGEYTWGDVVYSVNGYINTVVLTYSDVGAPATDGTDASGTWNIDISGNAAAATSATTATNVAGGAANRIVYQSNANTTTFAVAPTNPDTFLKWDGSAFIWGTIAGAGTVTSVGLALPTEFTISNSPVTSSGILTGAWANATANYVFAGPTTGSPGTPSFRALVAADVPTLNQNTTGSAASLSVVGQTGLFTVTGITSTNRVKTVRDADDTILELGGSYTPTGTWNWTTATVTWPTFNQNTTGSAGSVVNAVTFNNTGGAAAGTTFDGSVARTIDYSSVGAANSGANTNITSIDSITGGIATPDFINFDNALVAAPTTVEGGLYYNNDDNTATLQLIGNNGINLKLDEEQYYRVKASSSITKGQVVMITGTVGASGGLIGAPATGLTAIQTTNILGVATESISTNNWGYVTFFGEIKGLDTTGGAETWTDGTVLYYDPAVTGGLTKNKPAVPNAIVIVAAVVHANASNGILFIRPTFGSVLGGTDGNVNFGTLANGDIIVYDSGNQYWENAAQSTLTAGKATNLAGGLGGSVPYQSAADTTTFLGIGANTYLMTSTGSAPQWSDPAGVTVGTATNATTATNIAAGAQGSVPYQSGAGTTAFLAKDTNATRYLSNTGASNNPAWAQINLTDGVTGTLPIANGGTNATATPTAGTISYGTGTAYAFTTAGTSGQVLTSAGASAPTWTTATNANTASAIVQRDASGNFSAGTITATLTGNASTATSLAGGVASNIPYQSGVGTTAFLANGTAGQVLLSNGASAPSWGGVSGGTF